MYIEKGDIIQCPGCNRELLVVRKDVFNGEMVGCVNFKKIKDAPVTLAAGARMVCNNCRASYFNGHNIYIKNKGWAGGK